MDYSEAIDCARTAEDAGDQVCHGSKGRKAVLTVYLVVTVGVEIEVMADARGRVVVEKVEVRTKDQRGRVWVR